MDTGTVGVVGGAADDAAVEPEAAAAAEEAAVAMEACWACSAAACNAKTFCEEGGVSGGARGVGEVGGMAEYGEEAVAAAAAAAAA